MSESVREILGKSGPVGRALGADYEPRPEQLVMADHVVRALAEKSHLLVEAGTGVGKSYAYLVPAIQRILETGEKVVVVTNTIALQEQIVARDVPLLKAALDPDPASADPAPRHRLKAVLVKGRGNYVSIRRLKMASDRQDRLFADAAARRSLHVIEDWAAQTSDGTLSSLPPLERSGVWDKVQSDSGNCMGRKCPNYEDCFYQNARKTMDGANLLICNHALFFSDLALRAQEVGFLPQYDHVIFDEAHCVEDVAAEQLGLSLSEGRVQHLLTTLYQPRSGKGYLPQLTTLAGGPDGVERAISQVVATQDVAREFFESLLHAGVEGTGSDSQDFRTPVAQARSGRIRRAGIVSNILTPAMHEVVLALRALKDGCNNEPDRFELNAYAIRAHEIAVEAQTLIDQALPGYAYWIDVSGADNSGESTRFQRVTLACSPVEVGPILKERLFNQKHSVILTSATLSTRKVREDESTESAETAFAHCMARLGCEGARAVQLGSPFDHRTQVNFIVDRKAPSPKDPQYTAKLADRVLHFVEQTDGGAFVLFTSFATLNAVARRLDDEFRRRDMPLLVQSGSGAGAISRAHLLERFRQSDRSVLFGAASFWQGVDVRGQTLRNVIITRLPFEPPDRPLTEARIERIEAKGGDPFREDSLPRAVIRFKQGFGRLIRSRSDTGQVVVLDPRIVTSGYGRTFLAALPEGVYRSEIADDDTDWIPPE